MFGLKLVTITLIVISLNWEASGQFQIIRTGGANNEDNKLNNEQCQVKCKETYSKESNIVSCNRGCRLAAINEASTLTGNNDLDETTSQCKSNCASSYEASKEDITTCQRGCEFMAPILENRQQNLRSQIDNFFSDSGFDSLFHQIRLPRIFISASPRIYKIHEQDTKNPSVKTDEDVKNDDEESNEEENSLEAFPSFGGFQNGRISDMFNTINSMMQRTMERMHENLPEMLKGSAGKMIVVKSGPGYHETKTYNLGPSGFELEKEQDDMMNEENPNDEYHNKNDFEMINQESESFEDSTEEIEEMLNRINEEGVFGVEVFDPINTNNRIIEGPRLPESGLKTRYIHQNVCSQHTSDMKWSDWVSCAHMRIGMPRWLTAATISLGIVFAIWLCLAIPQNAPKQTIISNKSITKAALAKAKEAEANGKVISIVSVKTLDEKPPSYDEIGSNLKVNLAPLHGEPTKQAPYDENKESKA